MSHSASSKNMSRLAQVGIVWRLFLGSAGKKDENKSTRKGWGFFLRQRTQKLIDLVFFARDRLAQLSLAIPHSNSSSALSLGPADIFVIVLLFDPGQKGMYNRKSVCSVLSKTHDTHSLLGCEVESRCLLSFHGIFSLHVGL